MILYLWRPYVCSPSSYLSQSSTLARWIVAFGSTSSSPGIGWYLPVGICRDQLGGIVDTLHNWRRCSHVQLRTREGVAHTARHAIPFQSIVLLSDLRPALTAERVTSDLCVSVAALFVFAKFLHAFCMLDSTFALQLYPAACCALADAPTT